MICSTCKTEKDISEYRKNRKECKECQNTKVRDNYKEKNAKYLEEEKTDETICCSKCKTEKNKKDHFRVNRKTCKDCERSHGRKYRSENKDKSKEWSENNKERMSELQSNWFQKNKTEISEKRKTRLKTDGEFKKINDYRTKVRQMVKSKNDSYYDIIDCKSEHLKEWCKLFFKYFETETSIADHGKIWTIDHVIPIKDINEENRKHILSWYNIMPVTKKNNLKKNKYIDLEQIKRHLQVIKENKEEFSVDEEYINILAKHLDAGNSLTS
jgi:hypothetical protein